MSGRVALALLLCASACSKSPNCRLGPGPPGYELFTCPSGSVLIPIPDGQVPGGEIHGTIRLFGIEQNDNIKVSLVSGASSFGASTDASGAYELKDVIPGPYLLAMAYPAYLNDSIDRFLVLPEVTTIPLTTLYIGRNVFKAPTSDFTLSPTLDSFAIQGPGLTDIFDIKRFDETDITTDSDRVVYSHDGKRLYVHESKGDFQLLRWDVSAATKRVIGAKVSQWDLASDDRSVAMMDQDQHCLVWDEDRSEQIVLGDNCMAYAVTTGNEVLALVDGQAGRPLLVLWDITAHRGASLGPASALPPPNRFRAKTFTYQTPGRQWLVVSDGEARVLRPETPLDLSGDGHTLIVSGLPPDKRLSFEDVKSGRAILVALDGSGSFMPDGKTAALQSGDFTSLRLMDALTGDQWVVSEGPVQTYFQPLTGLDNAVGLVLADGDGFDPVVWRQDLGLLTIAQNTHDTVGTFTRTPDGNAVVFQSGTDLYLQELAAGATGQQLTDKALPPQLQISPDGQHVAFLESCDGCATGLGHLVVYDRQTRARNEVAGKVVAKNLYFTPHGDLLYVHDYLPLAQMGDLAVYTPCDGPGCTGAIQHELLHRVSDRPLMASEKGTRALAWTMPTTGARRGTLIDLRVPGSPVVTPVDNAVIEKDPIPVLTEKILAYSNGSDDRTGLFVTAFPNTTPPFGSPLGGP